jgi:hypothetical protein
VEKRVLTVDRNKQTAPGIELALELLLDNYPASWVHLRQAILLRLGNVFDIFNPFLLGLNLYLVTVHP